MLQNNKRQFKAPETSQFTLEQEGSSSFSTSSEYFSDSNASNEANSGGRNLSPVWEFFHRERTSSHGHFSARCSYCLAKWSRGEPQKLEAHLALECPNVDNEIRQIYLLRVAYRDNLEEQSENLTGSKKKKLNNNQPSLTKYFLQKTEDLSEGRINSINTSLLKAFVVCGISFSIIENPFFIDLLQNLCPNYQPPSREVLAGRLLDQEYSRVIIKRETIFHESENLTIGMYYIFINSELILYYLFKLYSLYIYVALDGWTSPNGNSIYSFMILTPMHNKFLYSLNDFSANSHTAEFLADKIDTILNEIGSDKFSAIVTDNARNVKLARQIIYKKYPNILSLNCIAHCLNLVSKDILSKYYKKDIYLIYIFINMSFFF